VTIVCLASVSNAATPSGSALSPVLEELAKPSVRSRAPAGQAKALGIAREGPGSLVREGGQVLAEVRFDRGAASRGGALRRAGARVLSVSRRYQTATVAVAPGSLRALAAVPGVQLVSESRTPLLSAPRASTAAVGATCEGGAVISEGVEQLRAAIARSKYGVNGAGLTVGVLSDSYDQATDAADGSGPVATHAAEDVGNGDLTGPANGCPGQSMTVNVLDDLGVSAPEASDEGRAMLQVIHDIAPRASLAFATAFHSEVSFAENIEELANAGANVIVDDVSWFEEPFFQDGPIAAAVNKVTSEGVIYLSSAGNNNLFDSSNREIASWEAPAYRDAGSCPAAVAALPGFNGTHCMNFKPSGGTDTTFGIKVSPHATLTADLQWEEPWYGVNTDLDFFLLNSKGEVVAISAAANPGELSEEGVTQKPVEILQWNNASSASQTVRLAINRFSGAANPRLKVALLQNGGGVTETEYPESSGEDVVGPTIFGHNGAATSISVGAINYQTTAQPERYSSRGPVTHYFGPVNGTIPAAALGSPESIAKPDLVATDCGATTFFAFEEANEWRFCGTSEAAPHAAAVAALELQAKPGASVSEVRNAQTSTAAPIVGFGPQAVGTGLLNAEAAVASLLPANAVTITGFPSSRTADSTPSFEFVSTNPETESFECFLDGVGAPCTSPYTVPVALADGLHSFEVSALNATSVVLDTASYAFTVDTTPPAVSFSATPAPLSSQARPAFAFAASEPASFTCAFDRAAPQPCESPFVAASALADGTHDFEVVATDQVGNVGHSSTSFSIDTVPPSVALTVPPSPSANRSPSFAFSATEPAAFTCTVDGQSQPCGSPFVVPAPLADGPHAFQVTAVDPAGNSGHATASFTVLASPPQTSFAKHPPSLVSTASRSVRLSFRFASDQAGSTFLCRVDGEAFHACGAKLSRRFTVGRHVVKVKARGVTGLLDPSPAISRVRVKRRG
jgi:Subtilase family